MKERNKSHESKIKNISYDTRAQLIFGAALILLTILGNFSSDFLWWWAQKFTNCNESEKCNFAVLNIFGTSIILFLAFIVFLFFKGLIKTTQRYKRRILPIRNKRTSYSFLKWVKKFIIEIIKPENIAKDLGFAAIILIFGVIFSYWFNVYVTPHPSININCLYNENNLEVEVTNVGNKVAHDVEIRVKSIMPCKFAMPIADTNYKGTDFFNISATPTKPPFNYEYLTGGRKLNTGQSFSFICLNSKIIEMRVGGENFGEVIKVCNSIN